MHNKKTRNINHKKNEHKFITYTYFIFITIGILLGASWLMYLVNEKKEQASYTSPAFNSPVSKNTDILPPKQIQSFYIAFKIVDIYQTPSTSPEIVTQALYGEPVTILSRQGSWVEVSLPDQFDYRGWLQEVNIKNISRQSNNSYKIVAVLSAKVRIQPRDNSPVMEELPIGTVLESELSQVSSKFTLVNLINGQKGYIDSTDILDYSKRDNSQVSSTHIIETARQFIGKPYLWGGMSTSGVDCSGFVHTVFKVHGLRLHRDADLQYFYDGVVPKM